MKNTFKRALFIIALVAVTGFGLVSCSDPSSSPSKTLVSIAVTKQPDKTQYNIGEDLVLTGMVVTATYSDGSTTPVTDYTISGYDKTKTGSQTVTVTYQEKKADFLVNVIDQIADGDNENEGDESGESEGGGGDPYIPPEDLPVKDRWGKWVANDSTATLEYSVGNNGVCTITVGGTAQPNNETDNWGRWKASAQYDYTAKAGKSYEYTFQAWTESGTRDLRVQYYNNTPGEVYLGDDVSITTTPTTYTVIGQALPTGGIQKVEFQCADQLGTFYVKVLGITEVTTYPAIELVASRWSNASGSAEEWSNDTIKLSDFTAVKPKQGDVLRFKISGTSDKALNYFSIDIHNHNGDWSGANWLGATDFIELSTDFNDIIFDITIWGTPTANVPIYLVLSNRLWRKDADGEYTHNSGMTLGTTPNGTAMATITNFKISFVGFVEEDDDDEGGHSEVWIKP